MKIVLGEDHYLVREGIKQVLASQPGFQIVAAAGSKDGVLEAVAGTRPDVVVTDVRMAPNEQTEGIEIATELRRCDPCVGVVVLSQYNEPRYALALFEAGANGRAYLLKERVHDRGALVGAIEAVHDGGSIVDPDVVQTLIAAEARTSAERWHDLTPRELEVLGEIATGKNNVAIAESLSITKRAVEHYINTIFWKLGLTEAADVNKRVMAVLILLSETGSEVPLPGFEPGFPP